MNSREISSIYLDSEPIENQIKRAKKILKNLMPFHEWQAVKERTENDIKKYKICENELKMIIAGESIFATVIVPIETRDKAEINMY